MLQLYFVGIIYVLIFIPHTVNTFFLQNVTNINAPHSLGCQLNNNQLPPRGLELCAIRVYSGLNGSQEISFTLYDGLRYMNTFRRIIEKNCNNTVNISQAGTGAWSCGVRLPFESYTVMQICVCASEDCNTNFDTCRNSTMNTTNMSSLMNFMPNLTSIIQCDDTLNASNICTEHPFINVSLCQDYVRNASVLCAITINNSTTTQQSLIYENYEIYLSEKVYQARSIPSNASNNTFNETATNVYYKYTDSTALPIEECVCTNSFCNQNITICAPQTIIIPTSSTTTQESKTTSSSNQQNSVQGEPGFGKAASAGLACGIIFSAVIFIGEIIFFKFFYSGGAASGGFERSVAYRA
ncbi:unnamed protein product [Rotaria sp. Silwood2]|nr:unnamed protein product [Rotaria sp. Silwood2]CAF4323398.1 unnamed protein product [Rotaria sp. Silwood2]